MSGRSTVWVDFENAPHVWVLSPLIEHLRARGLSVVLTARDFGPTLALCERLGHDVDVVGRSGSAKSRAAKTARIAERALLLHARLRGQRSGVVLALSHGSRSQILAARSLGVPALSLDDYEFSDQSVIRFVEHLLVPHPIQIENWGRFSYKVTHYPGLKEELYLCGFRPDAAPIPGLEGDRIKVLFRPEGRFAHYRSEHTARIEDALVHAFAEHPELLVVLLPRDPVQGAELARRLEEAGVAHWFPEQSLDGRNLLWQMDLVLSGGGTMTREAAVLGVPSYSYFAGRIGAVDRYLEERGRLVRLAAPEDVLELPFTRRPAAVPDVSGDALEFVTGFLDETVAELAAAA